MTTFDDLPPSDDDELEDWFDAPAEEEVPEDEFERLREASARSSDVHEDMDITESDEGGSFLGQFTPAQRFILAALFFVNVIVGGCIVLVLAGYLIACWVRWPEDNK